MIGIDTNILLRHTLEDDAVQSPRATAFLLDAARLTEPALLNPVVLIEFVWTLARRERFRKDDILQLLDILAASGRIAFTDDRAVREAIAAWRTGSADFQDYLIVGLNRQAGAPLTLTFDGAAAAEPGFAPLT
ncbi:PIN domain-containing protein [Methylobacterium oxalidis]|uniref:PIN domain-containing protein n=1 Tax=Methylobacterium oxalidis TaxID=944322 RepID=UPI0033153469